ncbi:MAG: hypothetical protein ACI8ZM_003138 [Crocinitomix sp.]|jgi:hypothetical protein
MYSESKKDQNKISHQPNRNQRNTSKAKTLVDNRPIAQLQKKGLTLVKSNVQNTVVQRVLKKSIENRLVESVEENDKKKFKRIFRAAAPGMDEMISCETTFQRCRVLYKSGKDSRMRRLIRISHGARHTTHGMGHIIKRKGKIKEFAHPTAKNKAFYARKITVKGNPRWIGHTGWDRARSRYVGKGRTSRGMRDRAIEFSYNSGAQPPFAKNSLKKRYRLDKESRRRHNERERMKRKHSGYSAKRKQAYDARWNPKRRKRGVSPDRGDL